MLNVPVATLDGRRAHIRDFAPALLEARRIQTRRHCFGCTAGSGST
jgi:hypothetical protein